MYGLQVFFFVLSSTLLSIVGAAPAPAPLSLPLNALVFNSTTSTNTTDYSSFEDKLRALLGQNPDDGSINFPAGAWLGQGLNMMAVLPTDIQSVTSAVVKFHPIIKPAGPTRNVKISDSTTWSVPANIDLSQDIVAGRSSFASFANGSAAALAVSGKGSLPFEWEIVKGDVSLDYAYQHMFQDSYQYALFDYNAQQFQVGFDDYRGAIDDGYLKALTDLLPPFDDNDKSIVDRYRGFFSIVGTHIITEVSYGSRLSLSIWADNSNDAVNHNFVLDIGAAFAGLPTGGEAGVAIKASAQYREFQASMQKSCSCHGGDPTLANNISSDPTNDIVFETYQNWIHSSKDTPAVISFATQPVWYLMYGSAIPELAEAATQLSLAYTYLIGNPQLHRTKCRLIISSNCGQLDLLTPAAFIKKDPKGSSPSGAFWESTKVGLPAQQDYVHDYTIDFYIINDGNPIDISLRHCVLPGQPVGSISVTLDTKNYTSTKSTSIGYNDEQFYECPVSPKAAPLSIMNPQNIMQDPAINVSTSKF